MSTLKPSDFSIAFVGCGNMGSAVLLGLLDRTTTQHRRDELSPAIASFVACTKTEKSARGLEDALGRHRPLVKILHGEFATAASQADVIVLGVKPYMARDLPHTPGLVESLRGKLVISMLAGVDLQTLRKLAKDPDDTSQPPIYFARAIPNLAARHGASSTILEACDDSLPVDLFARLQWIFDQVGTTKVLPPHLMNLGTVFNTACLTMMSVALEGLLDGCVATGLKRQDAMDIAIEGLQGLSVMLAHGSHPAVIRENAASPRGCTIQTLVSLEKAGVRGSYADALITGVQHLK